MSKLDYSNDVMFKGLPKVVVPYDQLSWTITVNANRHNYKTPQQPYPTYRKK